MKNWLDGWKMLCCLKVWFMAHVSVVHWKQIHLSRWKTSAFSFSRWSNFHQLHTITPTPRLDFQFRSHHLSRYHMPDFIFSELNQKLLCQFWVIFEHGKSDFSYILVKLCQNTRLKIAFWKAFNWKGWTTSWKRKCCMQTSALLFHFLCVVETILKFGKAKEEPLFICFPRFKGYNSSFPIASNENRWLFPFAQLLSVRAGVKFKIRYIGWEKWDLHVWWNRLAKASLTTSYRSSSFPILSLQSFAHTQHSSRSLLKAQNVSRKFWTTL